MFPAYNMVHGIYQGSQVSMSSSANLFDLPPTDVSILSTNYNVTVPSYNFQDSSNSLYFQIPPSGSQYMDLRSSFLYLKVKLLNQDGTSLAADDLVAPSNMFYYTMFKNCVVAVNGTVLSDSNNWYAHQSAIPTILLNSREKKESELTSILYYKDTEPDVLDSTKNTGFKTRLGLAAGSKVFEMIGGIPVNLFQIDKFLPTSCAVTVELKRQNPEFCLDCAPNRKSYKFEIVGAELHVKMNTLNPEIVAKHNINFQTLNAQYPLRDRSIRTAAMGLGTQSFAAPNLISGKLPTSVVVGLTSMIACAGKLDKSPLNFQHFGLTSITLSCDNNPALTRCIQMDFTNQNYLMGYKSLFKALGRRNHGNGIAREEYEKGNVLFYFDLESSFGHEFHLAKTGQLKVSLEFGSVLKEAVMLILFANFEGLMEIDDYRNVIIKD